MATGKGQITSQGAMATSRSPGNLKRGRLLVRTVIAHRSGNIFQESLPCTASSISSVWS